MTDTLQMDASPEDAPPDPTAPTHDAPYGRTEDGVLLDRNGKRAPHGLTRSGQRKHHPTQSERKGRKPTAKSPIRGRSITVKRRQGLQQLVDVPKGILLGLGLKTDNDVMLADAVTLDMHAAPLADAVAQLAEDNDQLGAVIDRLIEVGPYAAIGLAVGAFVAQVARNHALIPAPVAAMLGAQHDPDELAQVARASLQEVMGDGATQQQAAA